MDSEEWVVNLDSATGARVAVRLYGAVRGVRELRAQPDLPCVFLCPRRVLHPLQVAVAANKAALSRNAGTMITRTLHTEILYNMSPTKNISRSIATFRADEDGDVLVCCVTGPDDERQGDVWRLLEDAGELRPLRVLRTLTDVAGLRALYNLAHTDHHSDDRLLSLVVSRIVTKNLVSH